MEASLVPLAVALYVSQKLRKLSFVTCGKMTYSTLFDSVLLYVSGVLHQARVAARRLSVAATGALSMLSDQI